MTETYEPRLFIFSGAGLSAESGIPTFRTGDDALWDNHKLEDVCLLDNFEKNYVMCHEFYNARRAEFLGCKPNAAHLQIAKWEEQFGADRVVNLTTNIDLLLEDAGCTNVHHIHGRADQVIRNWNHVTKKGTHVETVHGGRIHYEHYSQRGELVKPNVVFFAEGNLHTEDGVQPLYEHYTNTIMGIRPQDMLIVVGASFQVVPIHMHCIGAPFKTINVNPFTDDDETCAIADSLFDVSLRRTAGKATELLDDYVQERMNG